MKIPTAVPESVIPAGTFQSPKDPIEEKKDRLDLRPAVEFVARHIDRYLEGYARLFGKEIDSASRIRIEYANVGCLANAGLQMRPEVIDHILPRLPAAILELSLLESVDYSNAANVPVPIFEEDGGWSGDHVMVNMHRFPRENDHPSRILIGYSTGKVIFPSALPASVCAAERARWLYQLHVLLHEFFHSVEYLRRSPEKRRLVVLDCMGRQFTLQRWWSMWEDEFLRSRRPPLATRYAASYKDMLSWEAMEKDPKGTERALAEQVCESFVGYILGVAPNDENEQIFWRHSGTAWELMDMLATSTVVRK